MISLVQFYNNFSNHKIVTNNEIYDAVDNLSKSVIPSAETKLDVFWEDFYAPLKKGNDIVLLPLSLSKYKDEFFLFLGRFGRIDIKKGGSLSDPYLCEILRSTKKFIKSNKYSHNYIEKHTPYYFRTGKVQGQYVLDNVTTKAAKHKLITSYNAHQRKKLVSEGSSFNEYLEICANCYRAAFPKETKNMTPRQMYDAFADKRDGGMLDIKDLNSREEFERWYRSDRWMGSHPFEIVFSFSSIGICLYPPYNKEKAYVLRTSNDMYVNHFLRMIKALIKCNVPFTVFQIEELLDFVTGKSYFTVNQSSKRDLNYSGERSDKRKYFRHIKWDRLKFLDKRVMNESYSKHFL